MMSVEAALARLDQIVSGIDAEERDSPEGWWETSTGAEFGSAKRAELRQLVIEIAASDV